MVYELTQKQKEQLKQFPKLETAINEFIELNGGSKIKGNLPLFIYWLRCKIEKYFDGDPAPLTGWCEVEDELTDEEGNTYTLDWDEDFWSWGHNSRWANTFASWVSDNFNDMVDVAIDVANEYGDDYESDEEDE